MALNRKKTKPDRREDLERELAAVKESLRLTKNEWLDAQELIGAVLHTADIGITVIDEKGIYVRTNDSFSKLFGYESGELTGKSFTITVPPGKKMDAIKKFNLLLAGKMVDEERIAVKKDGELFNICRTGNIIRYADGRKYLVAAVRDISETKKYRKILSNTEKITQMAGWEMDVSEEKITCTDELYNIVEMNKTGFGRLSLEKRLDRFFDKDDRQVMQKALDEAIRHGKSFDVEMPIMTGSKKKKWVRITCSPERIRSKTIRLIGTAQDITQKKETESEIERLSLVASKTNNAVIITDEKGRTVWVNESVEKMTGYKAEEFLGKKPGELLQGPETDKAAIGRMSRHLGKRLPFSEIIKNYKKDGTAFWINMDIAPVFKCKRLVNFIGIGMDVSELVRARETEKMKSEMEYQQKLFNAIANNFPDGILGVLDRHFHYVFVGGAEIKKLGLTRERFIGNKIFDHLSAKSNIDAIPFLKKALAGEHAYFDAEMLGNFYAVNAVPLYSDGKKTASQVLVVLYNITGRKKAEAEIRAALIRQKELNEMKSKFVSIASHEFRTPLSGILSSAFLVSRYGKLNDEEKVQKHIDRIVTSVHLLTDILNDFLSLGRIEDGKIENNITEFSVPEFCENLADEMQQTVKNGQSLIYRHEGEKSIISLDKQHLRNVLINLLSNAVKYSPEGKKIWLTSKTGNGHIQFTIKDEGIGIPALDQPHLFQTFYRANNATHIQGTGMGLHIVKRFLDIMGGDIRLNSKINEGSVFTIRFPSLDQQGSLADDDYELLP